MAFLKKHILVVDNEIHLRSSIKLLLRSRGYEVSDAENGKVALEKILVATMCNTAFDLLILDIQMPKMNGLELIDELRNRHIEIPVLIITGYGDRGLLMELMRRGCNQYLDKPFNEKVMLLKVTMILGEKENAQ